MAHPTWQPPKPDPRGWALATSLSPSRAGSAWDPRDVGPSHSSPGHCCAPTFPPGRPGLRPGYTMPSSHVQSGGLDAHAPFCSGGSGVGERPQREGLGPRQEEIFPQRRKERGRVKGHPFQRRQPIVSPPRPVTSLPAKHALICNAGGRSQQRRKPDGATPTWACVPGAAQ